MRARGILVLSLALHQCHLAVEIGLFCRVELQGHAASRRDSLQHCERVPGVFSVLKTGDHGLRGANLLGEFSLSQTRILAHLADQESEVNLVQGALEGLAIGCAFRARYSTISLCLSRLVVCLIGTGPSG